MTATIRVLPSGREFTAEPQETLLEAALRAGLALPYSCNNGSCGECKARLVSGELGAQQFHDYVFTQREKSDNYFLMCSTSAASDLVIEAVEAGGGEDIPLQCITTRIYKVERLNPEFAVLHLRTPRTQTLRFMAGQYVYLQLPCGDRQSLSIASCPCNAMYLQFHLRRRANDQSSQPFNKLAMSQPVELQGPFGDFTLHEDDRPIIFLAYGSGFAAMKSIIEHAIALELPQRMHLYWVAKKPGEHYLENYCRSWTDALDDFRFTLLANNQEQDAPEQEVVRHGLEQGAASIVSDYPDLRGISVYTNGPEPLLAGARSLWVAHGLESERLYIDPLAQR